MSDGKRTDELQGEIVHVYDGIEEADNKLPNWWLITFYGAIIFGIGYYFYYHEFDIEPTTSEQYALDAVEQGSADVAEESELLALMADPGAIAQGQEAFATTCAACHGDQAQGVIGPNLTDNQWLHGGDPSAIYNAIRAGITSDQALIQGSAGMPAWGPQLGEERVRAVVAYLLSIRDTNVDGREAEGEVYSPEGGDAAEPVDEEADDPNVVEGADGLDTDGADGEPTDTEPTDTEPTDTDATDTEEASDEGAEGDAEETGDTPAE